MHAFRAPPGGRGGIGIARSDGFWGDRQPPHTRARTFRSHNTRQSTRTKTTTHNDNMVRTMRPTHRQCTNKDKTARHYMITDNSNTHAAKHVQCDAYVAMTSTPNAMQPTTHPSTMQQTRPSTMQPTHPSTMQPTTHPSTHVFARSCPWVSRQTRSCDRPPPEEGGP